MLNVTTSMWLSPSTMFLNKCRIYHETILHKPFGDSLSQESEERSTWYIKSLQDRSASMVSVIPPWPAGLLRQPLQDNSHHSCYNGTSPVTTLLRRDSAVGLARCHLMHRALRRDRGAIIQPKTGKDVAIQGDKPSTGCVGSLALGKEASQDQGPFLCS